MTPKQLAQDLAFLEAHGFRSSDLTRLHHFSLKGRVVSLSDAIRYFEATTSLRGRNLDLAERCHYLMEQVMRGHTDFQALLTEALHRWPLNAESRIVRMPPAIHRQKRLQQVGARERPQTAKQFGDAGEALAVQLLTARGYHVELLPTNYPTYDIAVTGPGKSFLVSIKVARNRQHLRLGSRKAVDRLSEGNFLFAFLPRSSVEVNLTSGDYKLLILPALEVRSYALPMHDAYWAAKGKSDGYSVMVKAYDRRHQDVWQRWSEYEDAWVMLPPPHAKP